MSKKTSLILAISLIAAIGSSTTFAAKAKGRIDISTGVVYPSDNMALYTNSGALVSSEKTVEALVEPTGANFDAEGTFVGSSEAIGYGIGDTYFANQNIILGGVGFGGNSFGIGINAAYNVDNSVGSYDLGVQVGGKMGLGFGAVARGFTGGVDSFALGVGYRKPGSYQVELDWEYFDGTQASFLDPGVSFQLANGKVTIGAGYRFRIASGNSTTSSSGTFRAGIVFWASNTIALEYLYENRLGDHNIGAKFAL